MHQCQQFWSTNGTKDHEGHDENTQRCGTEIKVGMSCMNLIIGTKISIGFNKYYLRNMINEKELRVGNVYLSKRNKDVLVRGIDTINKLVIIEEPDIDAGKEQPYIFEDLAPIPLTKDALINVGFFVEPS